MPAHVHFYSIRLHQIKEDSAILPIFIQQSLLFVSLGNEDLKLKKI